MLVDDLYVEVEDILGYHSPISGVREVLAQVAQLSRQLMHHFFENHRIHILT